MMIHVCHDPFDLSQNEDSLGIEMPHSSMISIGIDRIAYMLFVGLVKFMSFFAFEKKVSAHEL